MSKSQQRADATDRLRLLEQVERDGKVERTPHDSWNRLSAIIDLRGDGLIEEDKDNERVFRITEKGRETLKQNAQGGQVV